MLLFCCCELLMLLSSTLSLSRIYILSKRKKSVMWSTVLQDSCPPPLCAIFHICLNLSEHPLPCPGMQSRKATAPGIFARVWLPHSGSHQPVANKSVRKKTLEKDMWIRSSTESDVLHRKKCGDWSTSLLPLLDTHSDKCAQYPWYEPLKVHIH